MGLFDDVVLDDDVLKLTREAYGGNAEIPAKGWQTKSLACNLDTVVLHESGIDVNEWTSKDLTKEVSFYQMDRRGEESKEWLEFQAIYIRGKQHHQ